MVGLATLESNLALLEKLGGYGADVAATSAMIETQIENRLYLYLVAGIRILTGVAFLGAVAMMKTKKPDANRFAALVCVGAVFYNMLVVLGVWICIPANIPGLPEGAGTGVAMMAVIFAGVWFGFKAAIYGGLIAYLMNKNNCSLFVPRQKSESLF